MKKIEFNSLSEQYRHMKNDIDEAIKSVLDSASYISGPQVTELEHELCDYVGRKRCVSCSNGTTALIIPLMAKGIRSGDAVFVPDFTFVATAEAVSLLGAKPIFCDVLNDTFNIDPDSLEEQIIKVINDGLYTPRAVIPVDLFGQPADYNRIYDICEKYNLFILEDAAQAFGGTLDGKKCGSFGEISATSFFPAKPLGCYGDGGAIFTDDEELASIMESIRIHGKGQHKYENVRIGFNARLDTIQAAVLLTKLKYFDAENKRRNEAAALYSELLNGVAETPAVRHDCLSSWAQYTIKLKDKVERDSLSEYLRLYEIPTMIYYPKPLHMQKAFAAEEYSQDDFPKSSDLCERVLSLPIYGYIGDEIIRFICEKIYEFFK